MNLSPKERAMLAGDQGPGVRKAMEIVTALGRIYGAERLVPVSSVQVAGVSYKNLGQAGLEFLREWADQGAYAHVPTTLNPAGMDLLRWCQLGFAPEFAERQLAVVDAFARMGIQTTCTCTPYLVGNRLRLGEHVAWAESSAVSFANSVLGARTNREGGPSALAAAITGRTAAYGLHLEANRRATLRVEVRCPVESPADLGALGYLVGQVARNRVPHLAFYASPALPATPAPQAARRGGASVRFTPDESHLKTFGAAMAASGAVALYHVEGVTPEARAGADVLTPDAEKLIVDDLAPGYAALSSPHLLPSGLRPPIDLIWVGCPHASLAEIERVVELLAGRRAQIALWVTCARQVREEADQQGLLAAIEASGGQVVADTCVVVAPVDQMGFRHMATPSAKGAFYGPSHARLAVSYGSLEACIEAAVCGHMPDQNNLTYLETN